MTAVGRASQTQVLDMAPEVTDVPLRIRRVTAEDVLSVTGAAVASLGLTWLLYERVLPFSGAFGFWVCWYVLFIVFYLAVAGLQWNRLVVRDKTMGRAGQHGRHLRLRGGHRADRL